MLVRRYYRVWSDRFVWLQHELLKWVLLDLLWHDCESFLLELGEVFVEFSSQRIDLLVIDYLLAALAVDREHFHGSLFLGRHHFDEHSEVVVAHADEMTHLAGSDRQPVACG